MTLLLRIGIVGLGVVGGAVKHGLERIGHRVSFFDLKHPETSLQDVLSADAIFICVPTPQASDGACDTSAVVELCAQLHDRGYSGLVAIKSTVVPGTTEILAKTYAPLRLAFCPEFLRERAAVVDFVENHDVCVIGAATNEDFLLLKEIHGSLPRHVAKLTPTEAELSKYYSNVFNALRVIFANEFYEVAKKLGANYSAIKAAMVKRDTICDAYLDCNENVRGFGGVCLPKDTAAFAALVRSLGLDMCLFDTIVEENKKFRVTVPEGMRIA